MNQGENVDPFIAIEARVIEGFEELRERGIGVMQKLVGIPVGRLKGPRGGIIKIRSRPGENPRKDTEVFHDSWESNVASESSGPTLMFSTNVPYSRYLLEMNRPYSRNFRREFTPAVIEVIRRAFSGK